MDPEVKKRRLLEKAMRQPVNDVVLEIQKGRIDLKDFIGQLDEKVRAKVKEAANG